MIADRGLLGAQPHRLRAGVSMVALAVLSGLSLAAQSGLGADDLDLLADFLGGRDGRRGREEQEAHNGRAQCSMHT